MELLEDRSLMAANLQLLSVNAPHSVALDSSPPAHISWEVTNNGDEFIPNDFWFDSVYLSADQTLDDSDTLLDFVAPFAPQLAPFQTYTGELNVTIPHVEAGTWYLIVSVDDDQLVDETSENDNVLATAITVTWPDVDLTSQFVSESPLNSVAGDSLLVTWQVNNLGADYALAPRTDRLYLSTDDFLDLNDTVLYEDQRYDGVAGGIFTQGTASITLPADLATGTYYLFIVADDNNDQIETEEFNNGNAIQLNIVDPGTNVDLITSDVTTPIELISSSNAEISYQLQNLGTSEVTGALTQSIYLSYDQTLDLFDDQLISREDVSTLLPIGSEGVTVTHDFIAYPSLYGNLYLLIVTDSLSNVAEDDETNNVTAVPIKVIGDDLTVNNVDAPTVVGVGTTTNLNFDVTNTGFLPSTSDYWSNGVYLSTDDVLDGTDTLIGSQQVYHGSESSPLNPSGSDQTSIDWLVPDVPSGTYYLIFVADINGEESERLEDNNYFIQAVDIGNGPDLTVSNVSVASPILLGSTVDVSYTISNVGVATADPVWFEQIFLSDDDVWDSSDVQVTNLNYSPTAPLAAGDSIDVTRSITFARGLVGPGKFLLVRIIGIPELNVDNNVGSAEVDTVAPDIELLTVNAPTNAVVSQQVNVSWSGKNVGTVSAVAQWADGVYLSTDQTLDASDTLLANSFFPDVTPLDPGESYSRSVNVVLPKVPAGTYYLIVSGLVSGQPDSDRSNNVIVSNPLAITVPDLIVSEATAPADAVLGDTIAVSYTVTNSSTSATGVTNVLDQVYLSDDPIYQSSDTFLTTVNVDSGLPLMAGASYTKNLSLRLNVGTAGAKYLIVRTDVANQQGETDETNNYRAIPINLTAPDLIVSDATVPPTASVGRSISVSFVVTNNSAVPAPANWIDYIQISSDQAGLSNNVSLISIPNNRSTPLAPGDSYTVNANITIPNNTNLGPMYLRFIANFVSGRQPESDATNNVFVLPITIVQDAVNLSIVSTDTPSIISDGQFVDVSYTVKNIGTIPTFANWFDNIYLSTDATLDNNDRFVLSKPFFNGPINPGDSVALTGQIFLSNVVPGHYYLLYSVDAANSQPETNENDNLLAVPIEVVGADLTVDSVVAPPSASFGAPFDLTYTVKNSGNSSATGSWTDRIAVISDADGSIVSTSTVLIANADVAAGDTYSRTVAITVLSDYPSGSYHIRVDADYGFSLGETDDSNNVGASDAITLTLPLTPDLLVSAVTVPAQAFLSQSILVNWTINNSGPVAASGTWFDHLVWVSGSDFYELGDFAITKTLAAGESVDRSLIVNAPPVPGNWKLQVTTDIFHQIPEGGADDNNLNLSSAMAVIAPTLPDLVVTSITPPIDGVLTGQPVQVTFVVTNQGASATLVPTWYDYVLFSQDPNLTFGGFKDGLSDQLINNQPYRAIPFENPVTLAPGESYSQTVTLPLLNDAPGTWYAYVAADALGGHFNPFPAVPEFDESNNFLRSAGFTVLQGPTANLEVTSASAISTTFSGQPISITWTTTNSGPAPTHISTWTDSVYLSTDETFDDSDILIGAAGHEGSLTSGQSYTTTQSFDLPEGIQGDYHLLIVTDSGANVLESPSEEDNVGATPTIHVNLTPPPDLVVQNLSSASSGSSGNTIVISFDVANMGSTATNAYLWKDAIYLSTTPGFDPGSSRLLKEIQRTGNLAVGASYSIQTTVDLPADADGQYYLVVVADHAQAVFELNRSNNTLANPFFVQFAPSNLVVSSINAPASMLAGATTTLQWTVSNTGIGDTGGAIWDDAVYYVDNDPGTADVLLATVTQIRTVAVGGNYTSSAIVTIPLNAQGQGRFVVVTDRDDNVFEGLHEDDNSANSFVNITPTSVDLFVTDISAPSSFLSGDQVSLSWTVNNVGATNALGSWLDDVFLSTDDVFDDQDTLLKSVLHEGGLTAGSSYVASADVQIPIAFTTGIYHILVRTDHPTATYFNDQFVNRVFEFGAEGNNVSTKQVAITGGPTPDLVTSAVTSPSVGYQQGSIDISWTVTNNGTAAAMQDWGDAVYLSYDQVFDRSRDILLGYAGRPATLGVGASYTNTLSVDLKNYPIGQAYIFVVADVTDNVFERNGNTGNTALAATPLSILPTLPIDLVVGNITIPSSGVAGTNVSITYTVTNNSSNASVGQWTDAIYLSTDGNWDPGDIFLGRVKHTSGVGANSSYTETLNAPLPGVDPGLYRVILRTDAKSQISETDESNNITASIDSIDVDVPEIIAGVATTGTIAAGQYRYYKIDVPAGQTLRFTLNGAAASSGAILFASFGVLPSTSQFDEQAISRDGKAELVIPGTSEGTYYVLVATPATAALDYSLVADLLPFGITSISNSAGGSGGSITLEIDGAGFTTGTKLELVQGDVVLVPTWMFISDSAHIFATFDLRGQSLGKYDVHVYTDALQQVVDPDTYEGDYMTVRVEDSVLTQGFEIMAGEGAHLETQLLLPSSVLANRVFPFQFIVRNTGTNDADAPVYLIDSSSGTPVSLDPSVSNDTPTWEQFVVAGGRRRMVLAPGESVTITLYALASSSTTMYFGNYIQSENMPATPINWDELESYYRDEQADDVWSTTWANFKSLVGTTWESLYDALRLAAADRLGVFDQTAQAVSAGDLVEDLLARAEAGQSDASGFYYQQSGIESGFQVEDAPLLPTLVSSQAFAALEMLARPAAEQESTPGLLLDIIEAEMRNVFGPTLKTATGSFDVGNVFDNFLNGSSSNKPLPQVFRNGSDSVEGANLRGFKNSQTTITLFNDYVIPLIRENIQKAVDEGKIGKGGGTFDVDMFSDGSDFFPNGFGDFKLNYSKNFDIPGLLAGGTGGGVYGPDKRKIEGTVTLKPQTDKCGHTTFDATFDLRMQVDDTFDFVDGNLGSSPLVQAVTSQLRLLEANDRAYGVRISAQWNVEINPIPKVASMKDDKKPPKQPPKNQCNTVPPDPDCNAGPAAAASASGPSCPDPRHQPDNGAPVDPRTPNDPNDITGPAGYGPDQFISSDSPLAYTIHFENQATATAAARSIMITTQLDSDLDWSSFRLGSIEFSNAFVNLTGAAPYFATRLDLTDTRGIFVDIAGSIDVTTGLVTWTLTAIDPSTGETPNDPSIGVLPPNEANGIGEGFVTFFVNAKDSVVTGDRIDAQATIIFDTELPISTPAIFNTIDADAPTSSVQTLSATSGPDISVQWSGSDNSGGAGITSYDIYVSVDGGEFSIWLSNSTNHSAVYHGHVGKSYAFYSVARDGVGNIEAKSPIAEASTLVDVGLSIVLSGPHQLVPSQAAFYSFSLAFANLSIIPEHFLLGIDWNHDGINDDYSSNGASIFVNHAIPDTNDVLITFYSSEFVTTVHTNFAINTISSGTASDPVQTGITNLYWNGTANDDWYRFIQIDASSVRVDTLSSDGTSVVDSTTFTGITGRVLIYAGLGNDHIDASGVSTLSLYIDGGSGDDTIIGGAADDVIDADGAEGHGNDWISAGDGNDVVHADATDSRAPAQSSGHDTVSGGQGNDTLYGDGAEGSNNDVINGDDGNDLILADGEFGALSAGSQGQDSISGGAGRDVIVAGIGIDHVSGDQDSDLIIAGATRHQSIESLRLIQAEWLSARPLQARAENILGIGSGPRNNDSAFLNAATVTLDDSAVDTIFGGDDQDWFIADGSEDDIEDFNPIDDLLTSSLS